MLQGMEVEKKELGREGRRDGELDRSLGKESKGEWKVGKKRLKRGERKEKKRRRDSQ